MDVKKIGGKRCKEYPSRAEEKTWQEMKKKCNKTLNSTNVSLFAPLTQCLRAQALETFD